MALRPNPNEQYEKLLLAAKKARLPYDKEAWLNLAFYLGEQYVEWADQAATVRRIPRRPGFQMTPRPIANKIMHFVNQEHSIVLQTRPTVDVLPASEDPMDISNANVAEAYLSWLAEPQVADFDGELASATMWALATTEGYLKWVWDPKKQHGNVFSCSPLDIYPDPYVKKFKDSRYVFHSQFMDVEQVYDLYDVEVKPSDIDRADPIKVALMREMGMAPVLQGCIVNELWMKPNRRHPEGLFVVWTNRDTLVPAQKFPYAHNRLPFTQLGSIMKPGTPHYTSAVSFLRAPQMELNKFHAQQVMVREAFANPKWWVPNEVELEADPDDSPRQILRGNSMGGQVQPHIIQPTTFPAQTDDGKWIRQEMMDVVGVHEVSSAQVPGRVEAAKAIELLKETDDGRMAELLRTIKTAISEGNWQLLMLAKQFMSAELMVQTYSREGLPEVKRFKKEMIKPAQRVRVTMGTGLAASKSARTDQIMLMWQNQIITDKELVAELLEMPVSSIDPGNAFDIRLARNENLTMAEGTPVRPNSWDNHDIHIREHNNYRKTQEFLELPTTVKTMFEFHVTMHEQLQVQALGKQLQIQQMAGEVAAGQGFQMGEQQAQQGAPGAPSGGSPPPGPGAGSPQESSGPPQQGPAIVPHAAGANPPPNPYAARDSVQAQAAYQNRTEQHLNHPKL